MIFDKNEPSLYNLIRSVKDEKTWIDAYNVQIDRIMKRKALFSLSSSDMRILQALLNNCTVAYIKYILKKHC